MRTCKGKLPVDLVLNLKLMYDAKELPKLPLVVQERGMGLHGANKLIVKLLVERKSRKQS
jgi:hypothetical protein